MRNDDLPALVRSLREGLALTQEQLAQRIGVTYSTINAWENGKRVPQPFLARRLAQLEEELRGTGDVPVPGTGPIHEMVSRIVDRFHPDKVILFGSHARGDARADSDVDLLVVMALPGPKREAQLEVRSALRDLRVPKDVIVTTPKDFDRRRRVVGTIERAASREGRILYDGG